MKITWALLMALLAGCATPRLSNPAPERRVRGEADALRVDREYRPSPTGAESLSLRFEHPEKAYYATCRKGGYSWRRFCR